MMCGSCSNENAYKMMFMTHMKKLRGGSVEFSQDEMNSCMINMPPGAPKLSLLSFVGRWYRIFFFCVCKIYVWICVAYEYFILNILVYN